MLMLRCSPPQAWASLAPATSPAASRPMSCTTSGTPPWRPPASSRSLSETILRAPGRTRMSSVNTVSGCAQSMSSARMARLVNPCMGASMSGRVPGCHGNMALISLPLVTGRESATHPAGQAR